MSAPDWLVARPIAHRGLHDAAAGVFENTLAAAEAAAGAGFAIECDVQDSADGEALVFHDHTLDRLTKASGAVRDRRAAELTQLAIGETQEHVPTLAELLEFVAGRVPVVVEIKSRFDGSMSLARRTIEVLRQTRGPAAIKSFDPEVLGFVRRKAPEIPRGIVAEATYADPSWAFLTPERKRAMAALLHWPETDPHFVSWHVADLPHAGPALARLLGQVPVMTWTVRTQEARRAAELHADQIVFEGFRP